MIPIEFIRSLSEQRDGYRVLLDAEGSLAAAAHRLARARCRSHAVATVVPTRVEVRAAAKEIARRAGLGPVQMSSARFAEECESLGLSVL